VLHDFHFFFCEVAVEDVFLWKFDIVEVEHFDDGLFFVCAGDVEFVFCGVH